MRIVVHGQQAFGKAVLEALLKRGENVVGVYVAPEKPGQKADPLKEAALAAKLPVFQPASYRKPEVWEEFKALKPDLQVMAFVTLFVPEEFLNIPTHGTIQYHPSLLPAYRGASAINWPIILGEKETGLSIFWPDNGLDTGDVLLQKKTPIGPEGHAGHGLLRSPVPDGRRRHAGIGRPGESRQGAAHQAGRGQGDLRRPCHGRHRPHRLGQVVAPDRSADARLQSRARCLDDARRQEPADLRHPAPSRHAIPRASAASMARSSKSRPTASPSSCPTAASRCCA